MNADDLQRMYREAFAPWVQALDLVVEDVAQPETRILWRAGPDLVRAIDENGIVSGQATSAVADTVAVLSLFALTEKPRLVTTVDLHVNFLRPIFVGDVAVVARVLSSGRKTAAVRTEFFEPSKGKLAATATGAFMYLEDA